MKKVIVGFMIAALTMSFTGCAMMPAPVQTPAQEEAALTEEESTEVVEEVMEEVPEEEIEEPELGDYPANEFEERVGVYAFESYDEIIGMLEGEEAYAYVQLMGADEPILLVTSYTYDNLDGNRAAIDATPYLLYPDGKYKAGSIMASGSTATPLALTDDGCIIVATHTSVEKECLGENGTDIPGIMVMSYIYTECGDDGEPETFGGFVRDKNTVVNNDGVEIAEDDEQSYLDAFAEYEESEVINFTYGDPEKAAEDELYFDPAEIAGSYVHFYSDEMDIDGEESVGIVDERIFIHDDGTALYSNQDAIVCELTSKSFVDASGTKYPYSVTEGMLVFGDDNAVFFRDDTGVEEDMDSLNDARYDYLYPSEDKTEVNPGVYNCYAYNDGVVEVYSLTVDEDNTATVSYKGNDVELKSVENGKAVTKDKTELECVVSQNCIAIKFEGEKTYTVFTLINESETEEE